MPDMFDWMREYKTWIAVGVTAALLGPCSPTKGCDYVKDSFKSTKSCIEQKLNALNAGKKPEEKDMQSSTLKNIIPPPPRPDESGSELPIDTEEQGLEGRIYQPTPKTIPAHKEYTIWIKDFSNNQDGTLRKITDATPKDLYEWTRSSAGGIYFQDVKKLDLKFINYQNKSIDLIAGKPMQSIDNGGHLYHEDNCKGKEYSFIPDTKQDEDAEKMSQESFTKQLEQYGSAVVAKKDNKAMIFFGADAAEVHYEKARGLVSSHDEFIVGSCPQQYSSGTGIPPYMQNQNPVILYQDRPVGPRHGFPGAVPMGNDPKRTGGPERRR